MPTSHRDDAEPGPPHPPPSRLSRSSWPWRTFAGRSDHAPPHDDDPETIRLGPKDPERREAQEGEEEDDAPLLPQHLQDLDASDPSALFAERRPSPLEKLKASPKARKYAMLTFIAVLTGWILFTAALPFDPAHRGGSGVLTRLKNATAVEEHLREGASILGYYGDVKGPRTTWMEAIPDATLLTRMNLPGTHDAATWNYSQATQDRFLNFTGTIPPAEIYRCQDRSFFHMLADGIRVFDLRIGFLPPPSTPHANGTEIGFYHGAALLSATTGLEDVLYGFYKFLDDHPSESLLVSIKADNTTWQPSQRALEEKVYDLTTQGIGAEFWVQDLASIGTLGEARGKITLLNRLAYTSLVPPPSFPKSSLGVPLPPSLWTDNSLRPFSIPYNNATNSSVYIEDYYEIQGSEGVENRVRGKEVAVQGHLRMAAEAVGKEAEALWITFASAEDDDDSPPVTPEIMALGNGTTTGVNQRLKVFLQKQGSSDWRKRRLGVVFMDWYHDVDGLVDTVLGL